VIFPITLMKLKPAERHNLSPTAGGARRAGIGIRRRNQVVEERCQLMVMLGDGLAVCAAPAAWRVLQPR
jgi:hypothetical protein